MTNFLATSEPEFLPPNMAKLEHMQRLFVEALMTADSNTQAAIMAGYGKNSVDMRTRSTTCARTAFRLLQNPTVLAAIREMAALKLREGALLGARVLMEIANDPMHKDRLKAADKLLQHSGFLIVNETRHIVEDRRLNDKELLEKATALAARLGIDPKRLLGSGAGVPTAVVVDADFTVVSDPIPEPEDDWSWQPD